VFAFASEKYLYYGLKYKVEILLLAVVVLFIFNLFIGKNRNRKLAEAFHARTISTIKKNFAH